jgi:CheY-like chemotaxis protein
VDGFGILKALKENESTKGIPVVVMSNLSGEQEMEQARQLGADDYVIKANMELEELGKLVIKKYLR